MPIFAAASTKSSSWRGATEKWSNVYYYFCAANIDSTQATDLAQQIVAAEKLCHSSAVTFEDVRVWEAGGTPAENETIVIHDSSGTGSLAVSILTWKELCLVVRCDTNRNTSTGRRIYLRKYFHTCGIPTAGAGKETGATALAAGDKTAVQTCLETLREVTVTGSVNLLLAAPGGQTVSDTRPVTVLDYPHIRQFRQ